MANASAVAEIRVETEPDDHQHVLLAIGRGEPVPLVCPGVRRADDAQRLGNLMDRVLVEAAQWTVLRRHADRPPSLSDTPTYQGRLGRAHRMRWARSALHGRRVGRDGPVPGEAVIDDRMGVGVAERDA